ncbi:GNAT family N-acetyltransferase [Zavarzinia sp. CC-PAN008]|uniref:GNAT family N-acetyltransferase n=1 Tax=Zavarzinia sp. CC-PAN008 TaxID=3243332 RepID=UPI003F74ACF6
MADVARLPAIERAAGARFADIGMAQIAAGEPQGVPEHEAAAAQGLDLVAWLDGEPVGFALCQVLDGTLYLDELSALPRVAGRGVGRALMAAVEGLARDRALPWVTLVTFVHVPWNGPFYGRLGFAPFVPDGPALMAIAAHEAARGWQDRIFMRKAIELIVAI